MMNPIIEKIKKLQALATSSNQHEAISAAKLADKLIAAHRISEEELAQVSGNAFQETPERYHSPLYVAWRITEWRMQLGFVLARHYGCAGYQKSNYETTINGDSHKVTRLWIVGRKSDCEIVDYLYDWVSNKIEALSKKECRGQGRIIANSYCVGFVEGIRQQLALQKAEIARQAEIENKSTALARVENRGNESYRAMYALVPGLKKRVNTSQALIAGSAYQQGVSAGKNLSLSKGLNTAPAKPNGLLK